MYRESLGSISLDGPLHTRYLVCIAPEYMYRDTGNTCIATASHQASLTVAVSQHISRWLDGPLHTRYLVSTVFFFFHVFNVYLINVSQEYNVSRRAVITSLASPGISGYLGCVDGLLHVRYICIDLTYLYFQPYLARISVYSPSVSPPSPRRAPIAAGRSSWRIARVWQNWSRTWNRP